MNVGDQIPTLHRELDLETLVRYAGASGDFNRIHYDAEYARAAAGLDGVIGHGLLAMALVIRATTDWIGDSGRVRRATARFSAPTRVGDRLTIGGEVIKQVSTSAVLRMHCVNQDGVTIISNAIVELAAETDS